MNIFDSIDQSLRAHIATTFDIATERAAQIEIAINTDEAKAEFGDINCNAAMVLAKVLQRNPRELAQQIIQSFKHPSVERIELAGPGFLNLFVTSDACHELAVALFTQKKEFFKLNPTAH